MNDVKSKAEISPDNEKDKYLGINDCIEYLRISKSEFAELIIQNSLEPKFLWAGYLETQMTLSLFEYTKLFYKKLNTCSLEEFEEISESTEKVILDGYVNFEGYISITGAKYSLMAFLKTEASKKLSIKDMCITANFTRDSVVTLIDHKQAPSKEAKYCKKELDNNEIYTIYKDSPNQELKVEDCKFLKEDVVQVIKKNKEIEIELEDNKRNKSYNGKELFAMIVPSIIRYIRERDQIKDKPQQDDGVVGLKKAVEDYLKGDESLKFLTSNFRKNWQTVINGKKEGQGKSILDKIFEEK